MAEHRPQAEDTPEILYKYRFFDPDGHHLRMIEKSEIWFASARSFNDPFDSCLQYDFGALNSEKAEKWAMGVIAREHPDLSQAEQSDLATKQLSLIRSNPEHLPWFRKHYKEINYEAFGICSLTPIPDSLLMWAHYADNHKGFCVGLDMQVISASRELSAQHGDNFTIHKVVYSEEMPRIDFFEAMMSIDKSEDLISILTTKSKDWEYEEEYRIIDWRSTNEAISVSEPGLAKIILGWRIDTENRNRILAAVNAMHRPIPVYQAYPEDYKFSLRIVPISIA